MLKIKTNEISYNIKDYVHLIMGSKKIGKSTLFSEIGRIECGLDKTLCISMGDEDGHQVLKGLPYVNPKNWDEFHEFIHDMVTHPENYPFELVSIDTIDVMVDMAIDKILKEHLIKYKEPCKSINDAFGGYGRGKEAVCRLISNEIETIKQSKYGLFLIGHNKVRPQEDKDGIKFLQLTSNLESQYYNTFAYKAAIICNIDVEQNIGDAILDSSGKQRKAGKLQNSERYMYFRSDGYIDAGSRFRNIPNRVPFTDDPRVAAQNYINAVKEGIKDADDFSGNDEDFNKLAKKANEIKEEKASQIAISTIKEDEDEKRNELFEHFKELLKSAGTKQKNDVVNLVKEWEYTTKDLETKASIEELQQLISILEENNFIS
jgi:hypothetical protein